MGYVTIFFFFFVVAIAFTRTVVSLRIITIVNCMSVLYTRLKLQQEA